MLDHAKTGEDPKLARTKVDGFLLELSDRLDPSPMQDVIAQHLASGGDRARAGVTYETCMLAGHSDGSALATAGCVEALHQASLIHDDLTDRSPSRRGRPAVWAEYGDAVALAAGDHLVSLAYACLAEAHALEPKRSLGVVHRAVSSTIRGQYAEMAGRHGTDIARRTPPFEKRVPDIFGMWSEMAVKKSGPLLTLGQELAMPRNGDPADLTRLREVGKTLSVGYQILDDCDDVGEDRAAPGTISNLCLLFECFGDLTPDEAIETSLMNARRALRKAAEDAACITGGLGVPTRKLALRKLSKTEGLLNAF